jgi:L-proline amide hydrolase
MTASSASIVTRMKVLRSPAGSTATWRFGAPSPRDVRPRPDIPLVIVPGGPGLPHGYLRSLIALTRPGRPVICYDPLGCGQSEPDPDAAAPWGFSTFVDELRMVIEHFSGPDGCTVLGHSSGGWIALEGMLGDAATRARVTKLVLASVPLDVPDFVHAQARLVSLLGARARRRLGKRPPARARRAAAYSRSYQHFLHAHICRPPWPPELTDAMAHSNREVYEALWGPSEVHVTGELHTWSCTDRVAVLDMPILLTSGRHDEVTPALMDQAAALLPTARWHLFENSAHMPHLEEPDHYLEAVDAFLQEPM